MIELTQDDGGYLKTSEVPSTITITKVKLRIPVREPQPPVRENFRNASDFCKAERAFLGRRSRSRQKYGTNPNWGQRARQVRLAEQLSGVRSRLFFERGGRSDGDG